MDASDAHVIMRRSQPGDDDRRYDRLWPARAADGSIRLAPEDGRVLVRCPLRMVLQQVATLENSGDLAEMMGAMARPATVLRLFDFELLVTEARVLWCQLKEEGGACLVGQVRHPWLMSVCYRPKLSWLEDPMIGLEFHQDFPVASLGSWFHTIELGFDKRVDPGPIAHAIATAAARHHLRHGAPPEAHPALTNLAESGPLPAPKKGDVTTYDTCVHVGFPGGVPYLGDGKPLGEWSNHSSVTR